MLSASYVSLVESGRRQPASSALNHIAERLGVDTGFLRDGIDAEVRRRARLAFGRAQAALSRGDVDDAYQRFAELADSPGLGDEQLRQVRMSRALAAERKGDLEDALRLLAELADEARRTPAVHPWMDVAEALCRCSREAGDLDLAIATGEEAMRHASELGLEATDEYVRLGCTVLAAYQERGDLARATLLAVNMVRIADAMGAPQTRGAAYWNASLVAESRGEIGQALVLVDRAVAMFGESDDRRNLARLRVTYAWLLLQQSPPEAERALELLDGTRSSLVEHSGAVDVSSCDTERARALLALGRVTEARRAARAVPGWARRPTTNRVGQRPPVAWPGAARAGRPGRLHRPMHLGRRNARVDGRNPAGSGGLARARGHLSRNRPGRRGHGRIRSRAASGPDRPRPGAQPRRRHGPPTGERPGKHLAGHPATSSAPSALAAHRRGVREPAGGAALSARMCAQRVARRDYPSIHLECVSRPAPVRPRVDRIRRRQPVPARRGVPTRHPRRRAGRRREPRRSPARRGSTLRAQPRQPG